jgi:hypothetical protein
MTAITNVLGKYGRTIGIDDSPVSLAGFIFKGIKGIGKLLEGLSSYEIGFGPEEELGNFEHVGKYNGKNVYAGSNGAIGRLLNEYGDPGHKGGKINYGAAFRDNVFVLDELVSGAADSGRADPLSNLKLKYVLDHEIAELQGVGHKNAHKIAKEKTGLNFTGLTFARY